MASLALNSRLGEASRAKTAFYSPETQRGSARQRSMECVRSCDQQPLKQKKAFALKRSLIPRGFIYSSNMADSILFTPPTWRT